MARKENNFKQTDIGLIPHDWEVISLGQIGDVKMCKRIFKSQTKESGEIPFYKIGTFGQTPDAFIPRSIFEEYKAKYSYPTLGVILLSAAGTIGRRVKYKGEDAYYQDSNIIWLSHIEDKVLNDYLYYAYSRVNWTTEKGAAISRLYNKLFLSAKIPQPPIEEQKRIAEVLSHFDEHIDNLVALLEKRKQVKAATMHALLSGATRLPGFTAPWQDKALGKLCLSMNSGGTPDSKNPNFYGGDIPFLSIADMTLQGKYVSKTSKTITKEGLDNSSARLVSRGVLLYAMYASLGKCSLSCIDLSISQAILAIETNPNLLSTNYLYYYLTYIEEAVKTLGQTGTQTNLSKQLVKEICVTAPTSVKEQEAIASILSNMDRGIEALEQEIKKYRQMKEGAMEELLTGKIRLL